MAYEDTCKSLEHQQESYDRNNRLFKAFLCILLFLFFMILALPSYLPVQFRNLSSWVIGVLIFVVLGIDINWLLKRWKYSLSTYDKLLLNTYEAIKSLDHFLNTQMTALSHRDDLQKYVRKINALLTANHGFPRDIIELLILIRGQGREIDNLIRNFNTKLV